MEWMNGWIGDTCAVPGIIDSPGPNLTAGSNGH